MYQLSYLQCSNSTIEVIRMTTNITTHAFCDLQPNTCYAIRVIAVNEKGPGEITSLNFTYIHFTVTHTSDTHSSEYSTSSRTLSFASSLSEHVIETNIKTQGV